MIEAEAIPGIIINGLLRGGIFALIALGLNLQYGVGKVFNIAYGELLMVGALVTFMLYTGAAGIDPLVSLIITGSITFLIGFGLYRTMFTSLRNRLPPAAFEGSSLLAAFGLIYIFQNIALLISGKIPSKKIIYLNYSREFMGVNIPINQLVAFCVAIAVGVAFYIFVNRSRLGKAIRAAAQDPATAGLMGINIKLVLALCFGFGALLAGISGSLICTYTSVSEVMGLGYTVTAIIVMVLGGLGSVQGSFVGGFILGIVSTIIVRLQLSSLLVPIYYGIFLILLLARPTGIFGKK